MNSRHKILRMFRAVGRGTFLAIVTLNAFALSACMKAERLSTDTNSPDGLLLGLSLGSIGSGLTRTVSGTITNLTGSGLVLANGANSVAVPTGATSFVFSAGISPGSSYGVTVSSRPYRQSCSIANGSGTMGSTDVSNVHVVCHDSGSMDTAFGNGGTVIAGSGTAHDQAYGLAVAPDGRIVLSGLCGSNAPFSSSCLLRLTSDGRVDTSFHGDGWTGVPLATMVNACPMADRSDPFMDWATPVAIDTSDQSIVVGGSIYGRVGTIPAEGCYTLYRVLADGSMDGQFGTLGLSVGRHHSAFTIEKIRSLSILPGADRSILTAGHKFASGNQQLVLALHDLRGAPDLRFGSAHSGYNTAGNSASGIYSSPGAIAIQPDRNILVAGTVNSSAGIIRFLSDGSQLDLTFDSVEKDGIVGNADAYSFTDMTVQGDGRILALSAQSSSPMTCRVWRYDSSGLLDSSFGNGGYADIPFTGVTSNLFCTRMAIQSDGKIVVAGRRYDPYGSDHFAFIARLDAQGSLDEAFTAGGVRRFPNSAPVQFNALALDGNGGIYAAGAQTISSYDDFYLVKVWE